ncbi:SUKH-4 family immunity protein [Streptomyces griseorubiginosus]|uniref:SUKH-4 family immunity protein n=1 Tax=Streptomyces griseorubiginosus TaxID=67304 RepID=UPI0036E52836
MVTFAQAQERAEEWINGDVPSYQHREVRVREFGLGFVVWAEDRADGPRSDGGAQRLVIARDSGEATLWPALPVGELIRRYEEEYGRDGGPEDAVPAPAARVDLNQTSFLLTPPEWLQDAADKLGLGDETGSSGDGASSGVSPGASSGASSAGGAGAASAARPWTGTDTNGGEGEDLSVALPDTVFSPPGNGVEDAVPAGAEVSDAVSGSGADGPGAGGSAYGYPQTVGGPEAGAPAPGAASYGYPQGAGGPGGPGAVSASGAPGALSTPGASGAEDGSPAAPAPASYGYPQGAPGAPAPAPSAGDIADLATSKLAPPGRGAQSAGSTPPPPPPGAPGVPGAQSGGASGPTSAAGGGYVPTQFVSAPGAEGPSNSGAPSAPATGAGSRPVPPPPPPPGAQGFPGAPGGPGAPSASGGPGSPGASAAPHASGGPAFPGAPGASGGPGAPGAPNAPGTPAFPAAPSTSGGPAFPEAPDTSGGPAFPAAPHASGGPAFPAAPSTSGGSAFPEAPNTSGGSAFPHGPGASGTQVFPDAPGTSSAPGTPPPPPGAPGPAQVPGPPGVPGGAHGAVHHAETVLSTPPPPPSPGAPGMPPAPPGATPPPPPPGAAAPPGAVPAHPGPMAPPPGAVPPPPGQPAPAPAPAYGYPQQSQPTVGPGYQAVLRYRAQDGSEQQLIRRSAPGTPHPEWQIFHELRAMNVPPNQVLELHTELESCELPGAYCARMIREQWPQARITSIAPYGTDHASRQQGMQQLLAHQGELHQVADGPARPAPVRAPLPPVQAAPPIPPEGIAQELGAAFGPGVFRFEQIAVDRQGVPPVVAHSLVVAGLPLDMGPFFWAQAQPGRPVPTLAELAAERGVRPASDAGSYLVMGSDFGKAICVQYGTANIVAVPVEAGPGGASVPPQFVNTGLPEFQRCLALLGRMWRLRFGLNQEQAGRWTVDFQAQLASFDPAALGSPESWWSVLLEEMWDGLL